MHWQGGWVDVETARWRGFGSSKVLKRWIVEGFAEYYSLRLLRRSGSLTTARFERAIDAQRTWAESADTLCSARSAGAVTALAVTRLYELDSEIRKSTAGRKNLDDVLQAMLSSKQRFNLDLMANAAQKVLGKKSDALHIDRLPGCHTLLSNAR